MDSTVTTSFRLSLPYALHALSPQLAAYHAARAHALHTQEASAALSHCAKCGSFLHDGASRTRTVRLKNKTHVPRSRAPPARRQHIERTCAACGHVQRVLLKRGNASLYPKVRGRAPVDAPTATRSIHTPAIIPRVRVEEPLLENLPSPSSSTSALAPSGSPLSSRTASPVPSPSASQLQAKKPRPKKHGLQEMLARNRERQQSKERSKTMQTSSSGLAAFLTDL